MFRLLGITFLISFVSAVAQTPPTAADDPTFRADTRLVVLPVSVLTKICMTACEVQVRKISSKARELFRRGLKL